jgi:hypothetical protein
MGERGIHTDDCIRFYVKLDFYRDMIMLHKELEESLDKLNETVVLVGRDRGLMRDVGKDTKLIGTTI